MEQLSDVGLIGLGVMGENLALNMERNGRRVSVWNRTVPGVEEGVAERFVEGRAAGKQILGFSDLSEFVASLNRPRIIMMMVRAGNAVDELIDQVSPFLAEGDVLIDGLYGYWATGSCLPCSWIAVCWSWSFRWGRGCPSGSFHHAGRSERGLAVDSPSFTRYGCKGSRRNPLL